MRRCVTGARCFVIVETRRTVVSLTYGPPHVVEDYSSAHAVDVQLLYFSESPPLFLHLMPLASSSRHLFPYLSLVHPRVFPDLPSSLTLCQMS